MSDAGKGVPGKGVPPPKGAGKGLGKGGGKGMSYKERREAELHETEDRLSAEQGFSGKQLTAEEARVLEEKGTEEQGTGEYDKFQPQRGYFACRKCGRPIYSYRAKFESGCGWPAFDKCFAGSIVARPEDDGTGRVEILCAGCAGHLGHVFLEPGAHAKARSDQRHCANSLALQYVKHDPPEGSLEEAALKMPAQAAAAEPAEVPVQVTLLLERQGDGATLPGPGDLVAIHYTGSLLASGVEFDTSRDAEPFEFKVDSGHVIQGWDDAVKRMPLGSRGLLIVPSSLAYGERGMPGAIPPRSDLLFDMELVSVNHRRAPKSLPQELTQAGFLHQHLTPVLKPAMMRLLAERPAEPCRRLLQLLQVDATSAEPLPALPPAASGPREYAALLRPLLQELSVAVLAGSERGEAVVPALTAWVKQNEQRRLGAGA
uniref:peptidylprolyl isomerase n=1 Tax=Alexandrium monilatum TaxID=311494 RepID=A0A7S4WBS7_9DINO